MPLVTRQSAPASADDVIRLPGVFPPVPETIRRRFAAEGDLWDQDIAKWWRTSVNAFNDFGRSNADATNDVVAQTADIVLRQDGFTVALTEERTARITADEALGRWIVTVSAIASSSQNISVQSTPPGSPGLNDLWVDNTDLLNPITYYWSGSAWTEQTNFVLAAAVAEERTARVTADGFLEGKYTLQVIAGDVVTGMNITSSTGTGTNISSVIFRATDFKIYNGVTGVTMFNVSGSNVNLANTLTVSTSGKVFTGTGSYGNANTPFYVDPTLFSLGSKLTFNAGALVIDGSGTFSGSITASSGAIGGWNIGSSTISANNAVLDSTGQLVLGTSNDVIILSATNITYRMWAGNATAGLASFSVSKAGALFSTSGTIGGFTIGADYLRDTADTFGLASTVTAGNDVRFWAGNTFINRTIAPLRFYEDGTGFMGGWTVGTTAISASGVSGAVTLYASGFVDFDYGSGATARELVVSGSTGLDFTYPTGELILRTQLAADANPWKRFDISVNGTMRWGNGSASFDCTLQRNSASTMRFISNLNVDNTLTAQDISATTSLSVSSSFTTSSTVTDVKDNNLRVTVAGSPVIVLNKDLPGVTISGNQIIGTRKTGWSAATGTATRTSYDTTTVTTEQLAERVKALIDDFISHGAIGT